MALRSVTVFGGSGFIGRYVVQRLVRAGAVVRVAVRRPERAGFLRPMGSVGQVVVQRVDVRDDDAVASVLDGADAAVNLIGILAESGTQNFTALQAEAPGRMARLAAAAGVARLVQVSAIGADAGSPARYASTKAAGEAAVRSAFPHAVILRPSIVFGAEDQFFNRFAALAQFAPALPLIGGGNTRFQPVYVGDVADAVIGALLNPVAMGKIYELGGPEVYSFRDLMTLVCRTIARNPVLVTIPWSLATLQAVVLQNLPGQLLTVDQVRLLRHDNIVAAGALGLSDLGIKATAVEAILPGQLARFRRADAS